MTWPNPFAWNKSASWGKINGTPIAGTCRNTAARTSMRRCTAPMGPSGDRIPADQLVGPLVVVDIRDRASANADTQLTPDDLRAWERQHGTIPAGAIVAMFSGWDARVGEARTFFGRMKGRLHFPGFHLEAVEFLHEERERQGDRHGHAEPRSRPQ